MNSKTILRNTVWYGLENAIGFLSSLITSVAIARTLGPTKMGYVIYVLWVSSIASSVGSIGIPAATSKYMAEFLGAGDQPTARFIYFRTLWLQVITATLATGACLVWVFRSAPPEFRVAAILLVLSIWPAMVNFVSAQANVASEEFSANLPGTAAGTGTFFTLIMMTLGFHWGVNGVAAAMLGMRTVEFLVRLVPAYLRFHSVAAPGWSHAPADLRRRMLHFALQSMAGMALTLIVWDRSEIFLIKYLSGNLAQIAFYSVAFSLAEKLLIFPTVFSSATGASVFAQYGRDRSRIAGMTTASARYLGLTSIPLHFIAAALGGVAILALDGPKYEGAMVVGMAAPLLCLPKAFLAPMQVLFEAVEKQKFFLWATVAASIVDVSVAWLLIPRYGALGAALGSGSAQMLAISVMWLVGIRRYQIKLPWAFLGKISLISAIAAATAYTVMVHVRGLAVASAYAIVVHASALLGLVIGGLVAVAVLLGLAALLRVFEEQDLARLKIIVDACPKMFAVPVNLTYSWMSRRIAPAVTEELL